MQSNPDMAAKLIQNALDKGMVGDYVLMDTWFTHAPLMESIAEKVLFVIRMIKQMKQRYLYDEELLKLDDLFKSVRPPFKKGFARIYSSTLHTEDQTPVKIVFVTNRNKKSEWLAILSTDTALSNEEIIRIYGMH